MDYFKFEVNKTHQNKIKMDIVDIMQVLGYVGVLIAGYILFFMQDKLPRICGQYTQPGKFFLQSKSFTIISLYENENVKNV